MSLAVPRDDARALHYALLASILLHALLLQFFPRPHEGWQPVQPAPLVARLVEPPAPPVVEEPVPAKPIKPAKPKAVAPRTPASVAKAETAAAAQEPAARQEAAPPAVVEAAPAAEAPSQAPLPATAPPTAEPQAARPELDPGALAKYRLEVISLARQFKRYPPLARENNWEGRAEVRMHFDPGAKRPAVELLKSSGYPVLDRQAVDTLSKALAPLPPALRGRQFALDIPVIFNLDD